MQPPVTELNSLKYNGYDSGNLWDLLQTTAWLHTDRLHSQQDVWGSWFKDL